jgi:thiol-disulfide isomerase/thioredoxin/uncharacterized membrane protein YphA (DoxX/SURF4 family)
VDSFIIGVQLLLAGVFAVAGVAKLFDQTGSRQAVKDFGVPERAAPAVAVLLPIAEIATAAALLIHPTARWGGVAALALLIGFCAGIASAMARGKDVDCGCFGRVYSEVAGTRALVRNAILAALAAILVVRGPAPAIDQWIADRSAAELVAIGASLAALGLAFYAYGLWSENRKLRRDAAAPPSTEEAVAAKGLPKGKPEGLPVGTAAPQFTLAQMMRDGTLSLDSLLERGRPVVIQFIDPTCGSCVQLLPELARWQPTLAERLTIGVVTGGKAEDREKWEEYDVTDLMLDDTNEVFNAYNVRSTPTAIGVSEDGVVVSAPAGGAHMPEVLCRFMMRRAWARDGVSPPSPTGSAVVENEPRAT